MLLDHDRCYEALRSRDARFDGRFFVAVRTTGVYCRPICPSRLPLARNVDFYAHPAAAEAAGFRPCRRCQPDAAPGSPAWSLGADLVERAVRLIDEGALDGAGIGSLAGRLAVSPRHLTRLFAQHLGATPDAVARSRRAHLARRLLVDTDLSVAGVAFAAGFTSIRQCNDVVRTTFAATPTELRRAGRRTTAGTAGFAGGPGAPAGAGAALALRLSVRPPFDGGAVLEWFRARAVPGLETVDGSGYERTVRFGDVLGRVRLVPEAEVVRLMVELPDRTALAPTVAAARRLFDLDADPDAVDRHLALDPLLAPLVASHPGVRVPACWTGFEAVVRAVVGQQVSVAAARTLLGRIVERFGAGAFPEPAQLVDAPLEELGIIGRRSETIRDVACRAAGGLLPLDRTVDHDALVAALVAVPGIGPWTASYVALRLGEPDAFPAGDLHLRRVLGIRTDRAAIARAEPWRPWRAYAALHLWRAPAPLTTGA